VQWQAEVASVMRWTAHAPTRDFRKAHWQSEPVNANGDKTVQVELPRPDTGYTASFVEVQFPGRGGVRLSTTITVRGAEE
jgi:PhoPQ-activated pathogenicity-related protein